jgi:hydrogenase nickel incorporation protein HypA/HybF
MHEFSLASALVDQLLRISAAHAGGRITEVEVACGVMQQVEPEALRLAFAAVTADTPAAGARLVLTEEQLVAECRQCSVRYDASIDDLRCPKCGVAYCAILAGRDVILRSITLEEPDESPP